MMLRKKLRLKFTASAVIAGSVLLNTNATYAISVVFDQPSVFPGPYFSWGSNRSLDGGFSAQVWDDFILTNPTYIDRVTWQGIYLAELGTGNNPALPDTTSWEISFWSNDGGQPSVPLQSETFPVADVQSKFVGFTTFAGETVGNYEFNADLTNPFKVQKGETIWFSALANSPTFRPEFSWFEGLGDDNSSIQEFLNTGTRFTRISDRAFSLKGRVVPEPLTILGSGLALGFGAYFKKEYSRKQKKAKARLG